MNRARGAFIASVLALCSTVVVAQQQQAPGVDADALAAPGLAPIRCARLAIRTAS